MSPFRRLSRSLSLKVIAVALGMWLIGLSVIFFVVSRTTSRLLRQQVEREARTVASTLSVAIGASLEPKDPLPPNPETQRLVSAIALEHGVLSDLTVLDRTGVVIAKSNPGSITRELTDPHIRQILAGVRVLPEKDPLGDAIYFFEPIATPGGRPGVASGVLYGRLDYSEASRAHAISQQQRFLIASTAALVMGIVLYLVMFRAVIRPARTIAEAAQRLGDGDLRARSTIAADGDELQRVGLAFNQMATRLLESETALIRSDARFRTLLEHSPAIAWMQNEQGRFQFVNRRFLALMNRPEREVLGKTVLDLYPMPLAQEIHESDRNTLQSSTETLEELRFDAGGRTLTYLSAKFALRDELGHAYGLCGIAVDVTALKSAEQELVARERTLRQASEMARLGHFTWNSATDEVTCSEELKALFRFPTDRPITGPLLRSHIHPDDLPPINEFVAHATTTGSRSPLFEFRFRTVDGEERFGQAQAELITEGGTSTRWLGTFQDVTERIETQRERERIERRLLETQKLESLGILAGGIAHDFNNLLTGILGNASLSRLDLPRGSEAHGALSRIEEAAHRAADLCRQMLAYAGRGRFVIEHIDVSRMVQETTQLLQLSASQHAELKFDLQRDPLPVIADATQLRQVVMNLAMNASDAIGDAQGIIAIRTGALRASLEYLRGTHLAPELPEGDYVYLEVSDTGCGMSAETLQRIFDPFFTTKFMGRGLGLAAVLGIVRGHHGAIRVSSEVGRGSTFRVLLPVAPGHLETRPTAPSALAAVHPQGLVLVVDDDEAVRMVAFRILDGLGFRVLLAANGAEAVRAFSEEANAARLVLLDLTMPEMSTEETFTRLRQIRPDIEILLMSGYSEQAAVTKLGERSFSGFVQKPFSVESLGAAIRAVTHQAAPVNPDSALRH